jgi:hypothetical protein
VHELRLRAILGTPRAPGIYNPVGIFRAAGPLNPRVTVISQSRIAVSGSARAYYGRLEFVVGNPAIGIRGYSGGGAFLRFTIRDPRGRVRVAGGIGRPKLNGNNVRLGAVGKKRRPCISC